VASVSEPTVRPADAPCRSCPYRLDVPSGVWAADEYRKLPEYDAETAYQPVGLFYCHQQDGRLCAGWVGCHDMDEALAVRIGSATGVLDEDDLDAVLDYQSPVPLFASGAEAAAHGLRDLRTPGADAVRTIQRLARGRGRRAGVESAAVETKIIGQQGETRFLIEAGKVEGLPAGRVYDVTTGELSDALPVGSITAHSPGWEEPTASDEFLANVRERVAALS